MSRGAQRSFGCPWEGRGSAPQLAFDAQLVLAVLLAFARHTALSSGEQAGKHQRRAVGAANPTPKCSFWKLVRFLGARRLKAALGAPVRTALLGGQAGPGLLLVLPGIPFFSPLVGLLPLVLS